MATLDDVVAALAAIQSSLDAVQTTLGQMEGLLNGFVQVAIYSLAAQALGKNQTLPKPVWWDDLLAQFHLEGLPW